MNQAELQKLASENPEVRNALAVITENLEKIADEGTNFNENVPAQEGGEAPGGIAPAAGGMPVPPADEGLPLDPATGIPPEGGMPMEEPAPMGPGEEGAAAAQTFLAPVFDAAAQGDPSAQNVIAKAAGEVAKGVAAAAAEAMGGAPAPVAEATVMPATPEEEVANKIVPKKNDDEKKAEAEEGADGPPPEANNEGPEKVSMDLKVMGQLLSLARAGQL